MKRSLRNGGCGFPRIKPGCGYENKGRACSIHFCKLAAFSPCCLALSLSPTGKGKYLGLDSEPVPGHLKANEKESVNALVGQMKYYCFVLFKINFLFSDNLSFI